MRFHLVVGLVFLFIVGLVFLFAPGCGSDSSVRDAGPGPDAGPDGGPDLIDCVEPTGAGTTHGSRLVQAETWTAAASPHVLPNDTVIEARITLEPCAVVLIGERKTITVGTGGSIVAQGTARKPVTIRKRDNGRWSSIRAIGGRLSFTYTRVLGGGDPLNIVPDLAAALDIRADQDMPPAEILHADNLLVQDSGSQGISLTGSGGFSAASTRVVIERSAGYPIHAWANLVGTIPEGLYTGNSKDAILITGDGHATIRRDVTFHDRGVPYFVGPTTSLGLLRVGTMVPSQVATLTIEPGVTLRFKSGGLLQIEVFQGPDPARGALVAAGTQAKPIVFTSGAASPRAGDWLGIFFGLRPNARSKLDFVRVEYAGGSSVEGGASCPYPGTPPRTNHAAIRIFGEPPPTLITNTIISDSAAHGIDRGWRSDNMPSFLGGGNTFTRIAVDRCNQTLPSRASGACPPPAQVPCPR